MGKTEWLLTTLTLSVVDQVTKSKEPQGVLPLVYGLSKSIQSRKDYYNKSLGLPRLFKVFESYTDTSSNELGIVTTRGYCRLRSLRPSSLDKYRPIAFVSQNSLSRNTITVSPNWTTSHSRNLRVQRDTKGPTYLLTTNLLWDVLCLTSNRKVTA